jgi:hypothetical protein
MRRIYQRFIVVVILAGLQALEVRAQGVIAPFKLSLIILSGSLENPQPADPDPITRAPDPVIAPAELIDGKMQPIAAQVEKKGEPSRCLMAGSGSSEEGTRRYVIIEKNEHPAPAAGNTTKGNNSLQISSHQKPLTITKQ